MASLLRDLRHAVRLFRRTPMVTLIAILSLALTIGITAVVFTALKAVVLNPMPYARPEDLVMLSSAGLSGRWVSWSDIQDVARRNRSFQALGTYHYSLLNLRGDGSTPPQALYGLRVSASLFPALGVSPMIGRNILPEEDQPGRNAEMILSYGLWRQRFGADPNILGRTLTANGIDYRIIGVMPPGFDFPLRLATTVRTPAPYMQFWSPEGVDPSKDDRRNTGFGAVARLRPHVTEEQAQQDLASIARALEHEYPLSNKDRHIDVFSLDGYTLGRSRPALMLLMAAAALFMLIGCSNVANLLLARAVGRRREIGVRLALGAAHSRILRQLMTESLLLALAGGACAWTLAMTAWHLLPAMVPQNIPRLISAGVDSRVFAFTLGVALLNGLLFGLFPALRTRGDPADAFRESGGRGSAGPGRNRLRFGIVIAEIAVTVVLVVAGVRITSAFAKMMRGGVGFEPRHLLASIIVPQGPVYTAHPERTAALWQRLIEGARTLPGVESAAAVDALPFSGENYGAYVGTADSAVVSHTDENIAECDHVSADYLKTLGVGLVEGRRFTRADESNPAVAVIDENAARHFFPGRDPIGGRLCINCAAGQPPDWKQVVGVVHPIHHFSIEAPPEPEIYIAGDSLAHAQFLVLRVRGRAMDLAGPVRRMVAAADPSVPVYLSSEMTSLIGDSVADRRFVMAALAITAMLALALAMAGVYGVVSWAASQRTREIGIRVALGATRGGIQRLILGEGLAIAGLGLAIGTAAAILITRLLRGALAGLDSADAGSVLLAAVIVAVAATLATLVPARRATRVDPINALRHE